MCLSWVGFGDLDVCILVWDLRFEFDFYFGLGFVLRLGFGFDVLDFVFGF